ncbi:ankyrin repeat-containing domain protein, partial [Colletotrichum phormii]
GTPIQAAAALGHRDVVEFFLDKGANPNKMKSFAQRDGVYGTPLITASAHGQTEIMELLLKRGAEINAICPEIFQLYLEVASETGNTDIVQYDLGKWTSRGKPGFSFGKSLQLASKRGHEKVVRLLIQSGARVNDLGGTRMPALYKASLLGNSDAVQSFLDGGVDIHARFPGGKFTSALAAACKGGNIRIVELLMA